LGREHIEFIQSQNLKWEEGLLNIKERSELKSKILSYDHEDGSSTCIIKYPPGWHRDSTEYVLTDEEFYVLEGEISINELLQIKSTGSVNGKIVYGKIEVDDGGKLIGEINYRDKDNKQEEFKDWKAL